MPSIAAAQDVPVIDVVQHPGFNEPEAWAMKYFSSASQMTALGPVVARERGDLDLALEGSWVPNLDQEERTVGFGGIKEEDLNRTPLVGRVRATFGVGAKTSVTLGVVPPVELKDVKPELYSLGVERPIWQGGPWTLGLRLYGQLGTVKGSLTCTTRDSASPPGSPDNAFGCRASSNDRVKLRHYGLEAVASRVLSDRWTLHFGVDAVRHDLEFQVDAFTFDFHDRTLLETEGETYAATAGATLKLNKRWQLGVETFYAPLDRLQSPVFAVGAPEEVHDHLFNVRGLLRYKIR